MVLKMDESKQKRRGPARPGAAVIDLTVRIAERAEQRFVANIDRFLPHVAKSLREFCGQPNAHPWDACMMVTFGSRGQLDGAYVLSRQQVASSIWSRQIPGSAANCEAVARTLLTSRAPGTWGLHVVVAHHGKFIQKRHADGRRYGYVSIARVSHRTVEWPVSFQGVFLDTIIRAACGDAVADKAAALRGGA